MASFNFSISNLKNKCRLCNDMATTHYSGAGEESGFYCSEHIKPLMDSFFSRMKTLQKNRIKGA